MASAHPVKIKIMNWKCWYQTGIYVASVKNLISRGVLCFILSQNLYPTHGIIVLLHQPASSVLELCLIKRYNRRLMIILRKRINRMKKIKVRKGKGSLQKKALRGNIKKRKKCMRHLRALPSLIHLYHHPRHIIRLRHNIIIHLVQLRVRPMERDTCHISQECHHQARLHHIISPHATFIKTRLLKILWQPSIR